ncbi:MAG: hypothetical protein ACRDSP_13610 [Pseudonocardiaceae bacterium]
MSGKLRSWSIPLAVTAILTATAVPAFAAGAIDPAPIGPDEYFSGLVNGQTGQASIQMGCFGPIHPGQTGHPFAGQTVEVIPVAGPTSRDIGFTGSAATAIDATFPPPSTTSLPVVLHDYAVTEQIPTSLVLPCFGRGVVTFVPDPTSRTARTATVQVTFVGQP